MVESGFVLPVRGMSIQHGEWRRDDAKPAVLGQVKHVLGE